MASSGNTMMMVPAMFGQLRNYRFIGEVLDHQLVNLASERGGPMVPERMQRRAQALGMDAGWQRQYYLRPSFISDLSLIAPGGPLLEGNPLTPLQGRVLEDPTRHLIMPTTVHEHQFNTLAPRWYEHAALQADLLPR
jgi:hypothetical protein